MAFAVSWALSYTFVTGKHIRIDLVTPLAGRSLRQVLDYGGVALLGVFASIVAINAWAMAAESAEIGARSMSVLQIPLAYPQAAMALGFTALAVQAFVTLLAAPFRRLDDAHEAARDRALIQDI